MKSLVVAMLAALALFVAKPAAAAEAIDVAKLSCKQFTEYNDDNRGLIMMWFEGYYTEEDEPATIDFGKMAGHLAPDRVPSQPRQARVGGLRGRHGRLSLGLTGLSACVLAFFPFGMI
jgi:hypothetical protein